MIVKPGEAYWIDSTLPGEPSGGRHTSVVISSEAYHAESGFAVVASLRKQRPNAYRVRVRKSDFVAAPGQPPLDRDRVLGLDQCRGIGVSARLTAHGSVPVECVHQATALVPKQFQIASPPYKSRGRVWTVGTTAYGTDKIVEIINDRAAATDSMSQILALPYSTGVSDGPVMMVAKQDCVEHVYTLSPTEQSALDKLITFMFGVA